MQYNEEKIERLLKLATAIAYPENMLGIRKEDGVEEAVQAGTVNPCHAEAFEKSTRFEIFLNKEELKEFRDTLSALKG